MSPIRAGGWARSPPSVVGLFVGLTLLPFPLTGPIGHSLGDDALGVARRRARSASRCSASGSRSPASSAWARWT